MKSEGPWYAIEVTTATDGKDALGARLRKKIWAIISPSGYISCDENMSKENAHLAAAAPDLYEVVHLIRFGAIAMDDPRIKKALDKADGIK